MSKKQPSRKVFWEKLRFKYKLSLLNENTLEEVLSIHLSRLSGLIIVGAFAFVLITLTSLVIIKTPIRNYLPGYLDTEVRQEMIGNALLADSLNMELQKQARFLNNVSALLKGEMEIDEIAYPDTVIDAASVDLSISEMTADFVKRYEDEERYNLGAMLLPSNIPENISFFRPVKGMVSWTFNAQIKHYGIDIAASPKESVLATLKGTVIYAGFDANAGYVIQIQHPNGFVSVYKHNALLLKKQGDSVEGGEVIALVGNTGTLSTGNHLHFELWYEGKPVNPQDYINF